MKKNIPKDPSLLKPHDRFELSVRRAAEGDIEYCRQLARSCPEGDEEYFNLLNAAYHCTTQVALAIQVMVGRWRCIEGAILEVLDAEHVNYYYSVLRSYPKLLDEICWVAPTYLDLLTQNGTSAENLDTLSSEVAAKIVTLFLSHFLSCCCYHGVERLYAPQRSDPAESFFDYYSCMVTCYRVDVARWEMASALGKVWLTYVDFCRSVVHVEPLVLMKAYGTPAAVSLIDEFNQELAELDVEYDINQELESSLRDTWQSYNG